MQNSVKNLAAEQKRAMKIASRLKQLFPNSKIALNYSNNWELLVAVILSAQCTDKKVNEVTEKLFKKYPNFEDYNKANIKEFEQDIRSTGFYHSKAKNILASAEIIKEKYNKKIPCSMDKLLELPGVARKTANIVLGNACGIVEGIAVDTHVRRLSNLLGLSDNRDPVKIEKDLMRVLPKKEWQSFSYRLIDYGRTYCSARKHDHSACPLKEFYVK